MATAPDNNSDAPARIIPSSYKSYVTTGLEIQQSKELKLIAVSLGGDAFVNCRSPAIIYMSRQAANQLATAIVAAISVHDGESKGS